MTEKGSITAYLGILCYFYNLRKRGHPTAGPLTCGELVEDWIVSAKNMWWQLLILVRQRRSLWHIKHFTEDLPR